MNTPTSILQKDSAMASRLHTGAEVSNVGIARGAIEGAEVSGVSAQPKECKNEDVEENASRCHRSDVPQLRGHIGNRKAFGE